MNVASLFALIIKATKSHGAGKTGTETELRRNI